MLYAAIDMQHKQVTDIILGGDAANLYHELIELYNRFTPVDQRRKSFSSLDEAKRLTLEAVHRSYFPETMEAKPQSPKAVEVRPPAPQPPPLPSGGVVPPWARTATQDGNNNPNPSKPAPVQAAQPQPQATPTAPPKAEVTHQSMRPVARARMIFDEMAGRPRKDVIDACAAQGIKRSTAQTQYQAWKKAREESSTLPDATKPAGEGNMPRLAPGTYVGKNEMKH